MYFTIAPEKVILVFTKSLDSKHLRKINVFANLGFETLHQLIFWLRLRGIGVKIVIEFLFNALVLGILVLEKAETTNEIVSATVSIVRDTIFSCMS